MFVRHVSRVSDCPLGLSVMSRVPVCFFLFRSLPKSRKCVPGNQISQQRFHDRKSQKIRRKPAASRFAETRFAGTTDIPNSRKLKVLTRPIRKMLVRRRSSGNSSIQEVEHQKCILTTTILLPFSPEERHHADCLAVRASGSSTPAALYLSF